MAKSRSQPVNLPGAQSFMNPLHSCPMYTHSDMTGIYLLRLTSLPFSCAVISWLTISDTVIIISSALEVLGFSKNKFIMKKIRRRMVILTMKWPPILKQLHQWELIPCLQKVEYARVRQIVLVSEVNNWTIPFYLVHWGVWTLISFFALVPHYQIHVDTTLFFLRRVHAMQLVYKLVRCYIFWSKINMSQKNVATARANPGCLLHGWAQQPWGHRASNEGNLKLFGISDKNLWFLNLISDLSQKFIPHF